LVSPSAIVACYFETGKLSPSDEAYALNALGARATTAELAALAPLVSPMSWKQVETNSGWSAAVSAFCVARGAKPPFVLPPNTFGEDAVEEKP
jgi:hypothetical protein